MSMKKHSLQDHDKEQEKERYEVAENEAVIDDDLIANTAYEMTNFRERYEAEQEEREFMEDVGGLSLDQLLDVLREERRDWERLHVELYRATQTIQGVQKAFKESEEQKEQARQARLDGRKKNKAANASKSEQATAFGVPDFDALVRDTLKYFDILNKQEMVEKKDAIKEIRRIMIDLIIEENRSTSGLSRPEFERLAKKYLTSAKVRVGREQLRKYVNS